MSDTFVFDWAWVREESPPQYEQMLELIDFPESPDSPPPATTSNADVYPSYPPYHEESPELYYHSIFEPDQPSRKSISPPLIPRNRPQVSQKRPKPPSVLSNPLTMATSYSPNSFPMPEEPHLPTRPPPIQLDGRYLAQNNEGYLTPPLTSKSFSPPTATQGPFGGYNTPTIVPSDIV
jgi:hypothetical protein